MFNLNPTWLFTMRIPTFVFYNAHVHRACHVICHNVPCFSSIFNTNCDLLIKPYSNWSLIWENVVQPKISFSSQIQRNALQCPTSLTLPPLLLRQWGPWCLFPFQPCQICLLTQFCLKSTLFRLLCLDVVSCAVCAQLAPNTPSPPLPPPTRPRERPRRSLCRRNGTSTRGVPILVARFDGPGPGAQQRHDGAQLMISWPRHLKMEIRAQSDWFESQGDGHGRPSGLTACKMRPMAHFFCCCPLYAIIII